MYVCMYSIGVLCVYVCSDVKKTEEHGDFRSLLCTPFVIELQPLVSPFCLRPHLFLMFLPFPAQSQTFKSEAYLEFI
mgnify:CR=1 FL=1